MDPLDMIPVCRKCYDEQLQQGTRDDAEKLRNHGGCHCNQSNGQRDSVVYTVIDVESGNNYFTAMPKNSLAAPAPLK